MAYSKLYHDKFSIPVNVIIAFFFAVSMFAYWMYVSGAITEFALIVRQVFTSGTPPISPNISAQASLSAQIFAYSGMILFFSLVCIGLFYMISKSGSKNSFALAIGEIVIFALAAFSLFGGRHIMLEGRWIYFSQALLAIPLGLTVLLLYKVIAHNLIRNILPMALVSIMAFFLIISPQVNLDNPTFFQVSRSAFFESELQAMHTVSGMWDGTIAGDGFSSNPFIFLNYKSPTNYFWLDDSLKNRDFTDCQDKMVFIRKEIISSSIHTSNYDPTQTLEEQGFSRVYESASASAFVKLAR